MFQSPSLCSIQQDAWACSAAFLQAYRPLASIHHFSSVTTVQAPILYNMQPPLMTILDSLAGTVKSHATPRPFLDFSNSNIRWDLDKPCS